MPSTQGRIAVTAAALLAGLSLRRKDRHSLAPEERALQERTHEEGRGRGASSPLQIPAAGWKDILWRTFQQLSRDRVMLIAAGVTFYGLLALFPALTALISIYGLFADPATVLEHTDLMAGFLPEEALTLISGQMERVASQPPGQLGLGFLIGLGVALWSANNGMKAIFDATNVAYNEREKRSFIRLTLETFAFTLGAIAVIILTVSAIVVLPVVMSFIGLDGGTERMIQVMRWPLLLVVIVIAISLIYRFGPSRNPAGWKWIMVGSITASLVWVIVSILFSWYVSNFGAYNETYGSLGAAIGFMMWMWVSATVVIMGAELNSETERQTRQDSTVGTSKPLGKRRAQAADTVGPKAG